MATNTADSLTREAEEIRARIARDQERLGEIETLLHLAAKYNLVGMVEKYYSAPNPTQRVTPGAMTNVMTAGSDPLRFGSKIKDQILNSAEEVLSDGKRRISRDLLRDMAKLGVIVRGQDPVINLSSYLSREKERFESDIKAGGWTLRRLLKTARPGDAATSSGLLFNNTVNGADQHPEPQG